jgi:hypothetical protein
LPWTGIRLAFQPGQALLEGGGGQRLHVDVDHFGEIGRLRGREIAGGDRGHDGVCCRSAFA